MKDFETIHACRSCGRADLAPFFDLGMQPFANSLLESPRAQEKSYPLSLSWCERCNLVQLSYTADPQELFSNYVWVTGTSKAAQSFAEKFYQEFIARPPAGKVGYVLEVASNDGTFLRPFQRNGYEVLGVDPAQNIVDMAEMSGIPTRCVFFGIPAAREIRDEKGPASMVFARNVLPHVANTHDFVDGLREVIADDGVLAIETHYAKIILEELHYDSIYHEHLCYFTFKSLERLLNDHGLYVFDITQSLISGGGIVVYAKKAKTTPSRAVLEYRTREIESKTNELSKWEDFARRSFAHKEKLLGILQEIQKKNERVVGWGASARSSTMLNFCGIDSRILPMIVDLNPMKQGKFTAGTHIPIDKPDTVLARKPDSVFILAWNFSDEIMEMLKTKYHFTGSYIIPLPKEPRIVQ